MKRHLLSKLILQSCVVASFLLVALASCTQNPPKDAVAVQTDPESLPEPAETKATETKTTDQEMIEKAIDAAVDLGKTTVRHWQVNDSIRLSQREKMYGYQIGFPVDREKELFDEFEKLSNTKEVIVLKSKKDYYVIKYEGKEESELKDSLESLKASMGRNDIKLINLMSLCSKRDKLVVGEKITRRKEKNELPCLICK